MKIRTREELFDQLDKDSAWRKQELTNILFSLMEKSGAYEDYRIRSAIALTYAHWEGFIKTSSESYLIYMSFLNLKGSQVHGGLMKSYLQMKAINNGELKKYDTFSTFWDFIDIEFMDSKLFWDHKKIVNTKSNLRYEIFCELANKLGLELVHYETKQAKIDALVNHRNSIAHGEKPRITLDEAMEYVEIVRALIENFKTDLTNSILLEKFLKK